MHTQVVYESADEAKKYINKILNDIYSVNRVFCIDNVVIYPGSPKSYWGTKLGGHSSLAFFCRSSFAPFLFYSTLSDIEINVTNDNKTKCYKLHKLILANFTDFFHADLYNKSASKTVLTINENIDLFDKMIDIIYGKVTIIHRVEGLRILRLLDKYGVRFNDMVEEEFDMDKYITYMTPPSRHEFIDYLCELKNIYPDFDNISADLNIWIEFALNEYSTDDENYNSKFVRSINEYLPKNLRNDFTID